VGEVDVDALLARLSSTQISEWMAYYALDPFGEERADLRAAMIMSLIANVNRDAEKKREPYTAEDFMPRFGQPPPEPAAAPWEQQKEMLKAMTGQRKK